MAHPHYENKQKIKVPSVTEIISSNCGWNKTVLMAWQRKMLLAGRDPNKIKENAASIGSLVHLYIERFILGESITDKDLKDYKPEAIIIAESGLEQFKKKIGESKIEFLETEMSLVSDVYNFGGTLDCIYKRPGVEIGLGDNKTSKSIYSDYIIQLGGYDILLNEKTGYKPVESLIIKISKDITKPDDEIVSLKFIDIYTVKEGSKVFLNLLENNLYRNKFDKYLETLNKSEYNKVSYHQNEGTSL